MEEKRDEKIVKSESRGERKEGVTDVKGNN